MAVLTPRKLGQNVGRVYLRANAPLQVPTLPSWPWLPSEIGKGMGLWHLCIQETAPAVLLSTRCLCLLLLSGYGLSSLVCHSRPCTPSPGPGVWRCSVTSWEVSGPFSGPSSSLVLFLGTWDILQIAHYLPNTQWTQFPSPGFHGSAVTSSIPVCVLEDTPHWSCLPQSLSLSPRQNQQSHL